MKRLAAVFIAILVSACVRVPGAPASADATGSTPSAVASGPAIALAVAASDVTIATGPGVWVLADTNLYRFADGRLVPEDAPAGIAWDAIAVTTGSIVLAGVTDGSTVDVAIADPATLNWEVDKVAFNAPAGLAELSVGAIGKRLLLLANNGSSSGTLSGALAISDDLGGSWKIVDAPAGGRLTAAATEFWITGGPQMDQLYSSLDGNSWTDVTPRVADQYFSVGLPTSTKRGVIVPTASHNKGDSAVAFWAVPSAANAPLATLDAPHTEFQMTIPVAVAGSGKYFVLWPDGSKLFTADGFAEPTIVSPNGLDGTIIGASSIDDTTLLALAVRGSCPTGKSSCSSSTTLEWSTDGGQTWADVTQ